MIEQEYVVVDLRDMLLWLLKKWWIFILFGILGAGLLGGYEVLKAPVLAVVEEETEQTATTPTPTPVPTLEDQRAKLSEAQATAVERVYADYLEVRAKIEELDTQILAMDVKTPEDDAALKALYSTQSTWISYNNNLIASLSADQKLYFEELRKNMTEDEKAAVEEANSANVADVDELSEVYEPKHVKTMVLLGGFLGVAVMGVLLVCIYMFDGKVKSIKELKYTYHLDVLDTVDVRAPKAAEMLVENLVMLLSQNEYGTIFVTTEKGNASDKQMVQALSDSIKGEDEDIVLHSGDPLLDAKALQRLADSDAVMLLVQLKHTRRTDVVRRMELCKRFDKTMVVSVVLS